MSEVSLVCEGHPRGRDVRWLGLVVGELASTGEIDANVTILPAGSKADLGAAVRALKELQKTNHVYAVRDRDFLRRDLVTRLRGGEVYPLERHCLESYLIEPSVIEAAFGAKGVERFLAQSAERRFWKDVARAVADDIAYQLREVFRLSISRANAPVASEEEATSLLSTMLEPLPEQIRSAMPDACALVRSFAEDMRSMPSWTRADGCELLNGLEQELRGSVLPGGNLEGKLFDWCKERRPPEPLLNDIKQALLTWTAAPLRHPASPAA